MCENNLTVFTNGHHRPGHRFNGTSHNFGFPYKVPYSNSAHGAPETSNDHNDFYPEIREDAHSVQRRRLTDAGPTSAAGELFLNTAEANNVYRNSLIATAIRHNNGVLVDQFQTNDMYSENSGDITTNSDISSYIQNWQMQNNSPESLPTQWPFSASTISSAGSLVGQGFPISPNDDFVLSPEGKPSSSCATLERSWLAAETPCASSSSGMVFPQPGTASVNSAKYSIPAFPQSSVNHSDMDELRFEDTRHLDSASTGHFSWEDLLEYRQANSTQIRNPVVKNDEYVALPHALVSNTQSITPADYALGSAVNYTMENGTHRAGTNYSIPQAQDFSIDEPNDNMITRSEDMHPSFDSPVVTHSPDPTGAFTVSVPLASGEAPSEVWEPMLSNLSNQNVVVSADSGSISSPLEVMETSTKLSAWVNS